MAATPYKSVNWQDNEPLFTSKLNQMAQNEQWLFENAPRTLYTAGGLRRSEGVKLASGILLCNPNSYGVQQHVVYFGSFFSASCSPQVFVQLVHQGEVRITFGVKGIGQTSIDHRGFEILGGAINHSKTWNNMTKQFWLNWFAIGF